MAEITKVEQLRLPEQLYILLMDPAEGEPRQKREAVKQILASAILWELLNDGWLINEENKIVGIKHLDSEVPYMRQAARIIAKHVPNSARHLTMELVSQMHPIWLAVGESMVAEHLMAENVQKRFIVFHHKVLRELGEARKDGLELKASLRQAAQNVWNPEYEAELAKTHPRLVARLVLLDNFQLLAPLIGSDAAQAMHPHIAELRSHLHDLVRDAQESRRDQKADGGDTSSSWGDSGTSSGWGDDGGIYYSGSDYWIDGHGSHGHHDGHDDDDDDGDGADGGDGGGGDGGGCGSCGGCGGCGG
jgi:hypothetical protein